MKISDGAGGGYEAKVDSDNRLHTEAVSRSELLQGIIQGVGYNFNTGPVTLTTANESAVGYFAYNGNEPFVITEILFILGTTTGGSGDGTARIYRNPTGGTIVDNALPIEIAANRDFGSSIVVDGDMYKGAEGYTVTGGTTFADSTRSSFGTVIAFDAAPILIRKGNTLCTTWQPPSGNTSQICKVAATGYVLTGKVSGDEG